MNYNFLLGNMNSGSRRTGQDKLSIRKPPRTMPADDRMTEAADEQQVGPTNQRANRKSRDPNFSTEEKDILILLITDKHNNGDVVNGNPTPLAWIEITKAYNSQVCTKKTAQQLKDSWKTLKKDYRKYNELAGRSGWGWDPVKNIPDATDNLWEEILQV
ncbi:hypothetical protein AXF42_Ash002278 [Apostasia shenzhenica]|uniref:Myb/SANT-like domain-containing protein n=1 Tax=Apostasia shenzhenica TaxID=1088818 RepID=A0A2I0AN68_9ASPA|nr:hypothetical protein AXF42_Ash002278 [Apostasia shenzhenica]